MEQSFANPLSPPLPDATQPRLRWGRLYGSAQALAMVNAAMRHTGPTVVVCPGGQRLDVLTHAFATFGANDCLTFPDWETLPYDLFSPHPDIVSQRLATLAALPDLKQGLVIIPVPALLQRLPPREYVAAHTLSLDQGDRFDLDDMRRRLERAGYQAVHQVMDPGEFAVRGGLMDIYAMGTDAWRLHARLPLLQGSPVTKIVGNTGVLRLDPQNRIYRSQMWAMIKNGKVRVLTTVNN